MMVKMMKKTLSLLLVLALLSTTIFSAMADTVTDTVINDDGTVTSTTTTTTTTAIADTEFVQETVDQDSTTSGTSHVDGAQVEGRESFDSITVYDANGNVVETDWVREGEETRTYTGQEFNEEACPDVVVELKPPASGEAASVATGTAGAETTVTGDTPVDEKDEEYDYTETTIVEREVTAETSAITTQATQTGTTQLTPVKPEMYDDDGKLMEGQYADGTEKTDIYNRESSNGVPEEFQWAAETEQAEYRYNGYVEDAADILRVYYKDENDQEGYADTLMFALQGKNQDLVYGYCVDLDTGANEGKYYTVDNLERGTYYASEESADHIRAIVKNGYWGTAEGTGSLDQIKKDLAASIENDTSITDEEEREALIAQIALLTEGEALTATQAAVWTYANGSADVQDSKPGKSVTGLKKESYLSDDLTEEEILAIQEADAASSARMTRLYEYLIGLSEPVTEENKPTEIITADHFVSDVRMTVKDKTEGREENGDEDQDNDVYNVEFTFKMEIAPDQAQDDLILVLKDGDQVVAQGRIAGQPAESQDEEFAFLHPDKEGKYTLGNVALQENAPMNLTLQLTGTQYLKEDVYVYTAEGGTGASQTFVGLAQGRKGVDVSMNMGFSFDVDESDTKIVHRKWRITDPISPEPVPHDGDQDIPEEDIPDEDVPLEDIPEEEVPLEDLPDGEVPLAELPDEEVPLAAVPMTGDSSLLFVALSILSGTGLAGLALTRKREEEA